MRYAPVVFAVAISLWVPLEAQPTALHQAPVPHLQGAAYAYLEAVVGSLARASASIQRINDTAAKPSVVDRMTAVKSGIIEVDIAARSLGPFLADAEHPTRQTATNALVEAYAWIGKALAGTRSIYDKLDTAKSSEDLAGLKGQISDVRVQYEQASAILAEAVTLAFGSAVVPDPADPQNHVALDMTVNERAQLIKSLDNQFGAAVRRTVTDDDSGPLKAAKFLFGALEKQWKYAK